MPSDAHFFIVGAGRSGTTLLRNIFSAHSRLGVAPETHFMKRAEAEGLYDDGPRDFDAMWQRLTGWVRFKDLGIDASEARRRITAKGRPSFRTIFDTMLVMYGERAGKPRVGEKTPSHTRYLDDLFSWFPDARAIALQRDPRAVVASHLKTPWGRSQIRPRSLAEGIFSNNQLNAVTHYAKVWNEFYGDILPQWSDDPRLLLVRYEDLVAEPEGNTRRLCEFLDEEFAPEMLADRSETDTPRPEGSMDDAEYDRWRERHDGQSAKPITASHLDKWRTQLSAFEIGLIEARCQKPMKHAGYHLASGAVRRHAFDTAARVHNGLGRIENILHRGFNR